MKKVQLVIVILMLLSIAALVYVNLPQPVPQLQNGGPPPLPPPLDNETANETAPPANETNDTGPVLEPCPEKPEGSVEIAGVGTFNFQPANITTMRPDIFKRCEFSLFDIIAYLNSTEQINADYHFNESQNTHVIDSINGQTGWWYEFHYSGGWPEVNTYRMDNLLYKDETYFKLYKASQTELQQIRNTFQAEMNRKRANAGRIIIPTVTINGKTFNKQFQNVEVTSHRYRHDVFQDNVTTVMDVIISLADQGEITYELKWYDSIGTQARVVRSYWVSKINSDEMVGRCGFVYGTDVSGMSYESAIHIPADTSIIESPEFINWQWICV